MSRKIYKRFGLRRDKNFGDLSNAKASLNNLLDGLVDDVDSTFISDDLNAIRNINNVGLTNSQYRTVAGSTIKYTTTTGQNQSYQPHITYQNRIDQFNVFSGNPRLSGGEGLDASYFQKDQLIPSQGHNPGPHFQHWKDTNSSASEVFTGITTMGAIPDDNFWERGVFDYTGKLHPQSVLTDGGVKWEGYFIPTKTGNYTFQVTTTGYATFDFNKDGYLEDNNNNQTAASVTAVGAGNTYTEFCRIGLNTSFSCDGSANTNTITLSADKSKTIGIGMSVSGSGLVNDGDIWPTVESYSNNQSGNATSVTLKPVPGETNSVGGSNFSGNTLTFSRRLGQSVISSFTSPYLIAFEKYKIRIRFFFPKDVDTSKLTRSIDIMKADPGGSMAHLYYWNLFPLDYKFTEASKGDFNKFYDTSVRFGGTNSDGIGGKSGDSNPYVKISTDNKVQAVYSPKTSLSAIEKRSGLSCTTTNGSVVMSCGDTGGIEVGNYIFGTNVDEGTRVESIIINQSIILDKEATGSGSQNMTFIDHRGFVKRVKGAASTSGGTTVNFDNPYKTSDSDFWGTKLKVGMIVLTTPQSGTNVPAFTRITGITAANRISITNGMTNSANTVIYFYQSRGLVDYSLETFCPQSGTDRTRCHLLPTNRDLDGDGVAEAYIAASGQKVIELVTVSGLSNGLVVEGTGLPSGTTIDSIGAANITVSNNLTRNINGGATVTIHQLTGSRQLCCPPTDTSPPFEATPNGLMSTNDESDLELTQGNLKFDELRIKFTNSDAGTPASDGRIEKYGTHGDTSVDRKLHIRTAGTPDQSNGLFYILGSTT